MLADSLRASSTRVAWLETDTLLYIHLDNGMRAVSRNDGPARVTVAMDSGGRLVGNVSALPGGRSALIVMCEAACSGSAWLADDMRTSRTTRLAADALDAWWLPAGLVAYAARDGPVYAAPFDVKTLSFTRTPVVALTGVRGTKDNAGMVVSAFGMALYAPGNGILSGVSDALPVWVSRSGTAGTGVVDTVVRLARGLNEVVLTPDSTAFPVRPVAPGSRDIVQARPRHGGAARGIARISGDWPLAVARWAVARVCLERIRAVGSVCPALPERERWAVAAVAGGLAPLMSRNGRELFHLDGAGMLVSAALLPDATFKLGTQAPLFNWTGYASNEISLFYDVSPDAQRALFLRPPVTVATGGKVELVQITNWAAEVRAKLAGAARWPAMTLDSLHVDRPPPHDSSSCSAPQFRGGGQSRGWHAVRACGAGWRTERRTLGAHTAVPPRL